MMASVRGILRVTVMPEPREDESWTLPPSESISRSDHVHAHSAPGYLRDGFGRGEARLEDQLVQLLVACLLGGREEAALDRLRADRFPVESPPVVGDLNEHVSA